jgi:hypothetical protein
MNSVSYQVFYNMDGPQCAKVGLPADPSADPPRFSNIEACKLYIKKIPGSLASSYQVVYKDDVLQCATMNLEPDPSAIPPRYAKLQDCNNSLDCRISEGCHLGGKCNINTGKCEGSGTPDTNVCTTQSTFSNAYYRAVQDAQRRDTKKMINVMYLYLVIHFIFLIWGIMLAFKSQPKENRVIHITLAVVFGPAYVLSYYLNMF